MIFAKRSASRMMISKALRRISAPLARLLRGPGRESGVGRIDCGLGVLNRGAGHRSDGLFGRRVDDVETAAVGGLFPFAADPEVGRHVGEKIFVHHYTCFDGGLSLNRAQNNGLRVGQFCSLTLRTKSPNS